MEIFSGGNNSLALIDKIKSEIIIAYTDQEFDFATGHNYVTVQPPTIEKYDLLSAITVMIATEKDVALKGFTSDGKVRLHNNSGSVVHATIWVTWAMKRKG